jgi:hypothetical protein
MANKKANAAAAKAKAIVEETKVAKNKRSASKRETAPVQETEKPLKTMRGRTMNKSEFQEVPPNSSVANPGNKVSGRPSSSAVAPKKTARSANKSKSPAPTKAAADKKPVKDVSPPPAKKPAAANKKSAPKPKSPEPVEEAPTPAPGKKGKNAGNKGKNAADDSKEETKIEKSPIGRKLAKAAEKPKSKSTHLI